MTAIARIFLTHWSPAVAELAQPIEEAGYRVISRWGGGLTRDLIDAVSPDLILVDSTLPELDLEALIRMSGRDGGPTPAVILVDPENDPETMLKGFAAGAADVFPVPLSRPHLVARLRSHVRLGILERELRRRADVMDRFDIDASRGLSRGSGKDDEHILVVGTFPNAALVDELRSQFVVETAEDSDEALSILLRGGFVGAVYGLSGNQGPPCNLCQSMVNNAGLYNLPILFIQPDVNADVEMLEAHTAQLGAAEILTGDSDTRVTVARLKAWVDQQHRRATLLASSHNVTSPLVLDNLTGLFSHGFLLDYLADLMADAEGRDMDFSVGHIQLQGLSEINQISGYASGDNMIRQVGNLIRSAIRAEDMAARFQGKEFCLILPQTPLDAAHLVVARVAGILQRTEMLLAGGAGVVRPRLTYGVTTIQHGERSMDLIGRAADMSRQLWLAAGTASH